MTVGGSAKEALRKLVEVAAPGRTVVAVVVPAFPIPTQTVTNRLYKTITPAQCTSPAPKAQRIPAQPIGLGTLAERIDALQRSAMC